MSNGNGNGNGNGESGSKHLEEMRRLAARADAQRRPAAQEDRSATPSGPKKHAPLSPEDQRFNQNIVVRPMGCDEKGHWLDDEIFQRDAELTLAIEGLRLLDPRAIAEQMSKFAKAMEAAGGDYDKLSPKEFTWLHLGGQISLNRIEILQAMHAPNQDGYGLMLEYVIPGSQQHGFDPTGRVPIATNYGFTTMPASGENLPLMQGVDLANLDATKINTGKPGGLKSRRTEMWKIWRASNAGHLFKLRDALNKWGVRTDSEVDRVALSQHGFERRGYNNAFKVVIARAAELFKRRHITYNTAMLMPPDAEPDMAGAMMPNMALRGSNEGVFRHWYRYQREQIDPIKVVDGDPPQERTVAEAHWDLFGNRVDKVMAAERGEFSVLRKGGFDEERLQLSGDALYASIVARMQGARAHIFNI